MTYVRRVPISKSRGGVNTRSNTESEFFGAEYMSTMILWGIDIWKYKAQMSIIIFFIKKKYYWNKMENRL